MSQMHHGALFSRKLETFIFLALLRLFSAEETDTTSVVIRYPACSMFDTGADDLRLRPAQALHKVSKQNGVVETRYMQSSARKKTILH